MEIHWTDTDPDTGTKRFVRATRFARAWTFAVRAKRRTEWEPAAAVTKAMWEELLDAMERRYPRREVTEAEVAAVRKVVAEWRDGPSV